MSEYDVDTSYEWLAVCSNIQTCAIYIYSTVFLYPIHVFASFFTSMVGLLQFQVNTYTLYSHYFTQSLHFKFNL